MKRFVLIVFLVGIIFLIIGIPLWITAVVQMLKYVPENKLITKQGVMRNTY